MRKAYLILLLLLVLPSVAALSFTSAPEILANNENITTTDPFWCEFTPSGDGALNANITWYLDGTNWPSDNQSISVTTGNPENSSSIDTVDTAKDQEWICQVTLYNDSSVLVANSSSETIYNSLPVIQPFFITTFYEDSSYSFYANATDADNDTISWFSIDLNSASYGGVELFEITSAGLIQVYETNEDLVGLHSMRIYADDGDSPYVARVVENFTLIAVNDAPIYDSETLIKSCTEQILCSDSVVANDQDNSSDELTYTTNESFINMSTNGSYYFTPTYAQAVQENFTIQVNVTDGINTAIDYLNLTLQTTNHVPNETYVNVSGTQGDLSYTFSFNLTDVLDPQDIFYATLNTSCGVNPWNFTNLSNGYGGTVAAFLINNSLDSNDYVVCNDITIVVSEYNVAPPDLRNTYYYNFELNITNINDAPVIYNESYYDNNLQSDIHNLSSSTDLEFYYRVNASDVDSLTYEGESFNFSLMGVPNFPSSSTPMFIINSTSGEITSVQSSMNASYLGNYSFTVMVLDDGGLNGTETINISIELNDAPVIFSLNTSDCADNFTCTKYLLGNDTEGGALSLTINSLTYTNPLNVSRNNYTEGEIISLLGINTVPVHDNLTSNFTLNFTPDDSEIGTFSLNFTMRDIVGKIDTEVLTFYVNATPEPPQLDNDSIDLVIEPISFGITAETLPFSKYIYAVDEDLTFNLDNLTFNWSFIGDNLSNFNISQIDNRTALISFVASSVDSANYTVNISVTDSYNFTTYQEVDFEVYDSSEFPNITNIKPFFNSSSGSTALTFAPVTENGSVTFTENQNVTFDVLARDKDNLSMVVYWYYDGSLEETYDYVDTHSFTKEFDYFSSGTHNVTVVVEDIGYDRYEWNISVTDSNRNPIFINGLYNLTGVSSVNGPQTFVKYMRQDSSDIIFIDPDDDINADDLITGSEINTLNFSVNTSGNCDEIATFTFSGNENLTITPTITGSCLTNFIATDPYGLIASSNYIEISVAKVSGSTAGTSTRTVTETITIPLEEDVPEDFELIYPGITTIYDNGTVLIPLTLHNTWDRSIGGISITANSTVPNATLFFPETDFAAIAVGAKIFTNLTITNYRVDAPFEVNVSAYIDSIDHTDVATIYVNALEKGSEDVNSLKTRIGFARDLLSDNPECAELTELLDRADDYGEDTLKIINAVVSGCKYLIAENQASQEEFPKSLTGKIGIYADSVLDYPLLINILIVMFVAALIVVVISRFTLKKI